MANPLKHALPVALALLGAAQVLASSHRAAPLIAYTLPDVAALRDADMPALRSQAMLLLARFAPRDAAATERHFRAALRIAPHDTCVLGAYADFLLDEGRAAEVPALLHGREDVDALLLRLALALRWQGDALALAPVRTQLQARFAAAARYGAVVHLREQARFTLHVLGNSRAALALAQRNWEVRRELADARILLEAATAAQDSAALLPVLRWMRARAPGAPAATAS